jgi:hypothetical protein
MIQVLPKPKMLSESMSIPEVDYDTVDIQDIKIEMSQGGPSAKRIVESLTVDGQDIHYTSRFGTSLAALYGFSNNMFKFFEPAEVIERIVDRGLGSRVRMAKQKNVDGSVTALGVTKPTKTIVPATDLLYTLTKGNIDGTQISYEDGVIRSAHVPSVLGKSNFQIGGDEMVNRFVIDTPIDGYGLPAAYLMLLRTVCSNGMVGYAKAFKSQVQLGKDAADAIPTFERFMQSFNNEEGFALMRDRVTAAYTSPASLDEFYRLHQLLTGNKMDSLHKDSKRKDNDGNTLQSDITRTLQEMGGNVLDIYGLVNLDNLSAKQRRKVPVQCKVSDLLNMSTEISTHMADTYQSRKIGAWVGTMLSDSGGYDLEGCLDDGEEAQDLFLTDYDDAHKDDDAKELSA